MKKLLFAAIMMLAISSYSMAQTAPAKMGKTHKKMDSKMAKSDTTKMMSHSKKMGKKTK